eukprot:jgi/Tetstr1/440137/TSEL_028494.t1
MENAHTKAKNLITEETARIVEISRVNVELIAWAWCKTRFKSRITYAEQQLDDYAMDTKVDNTWEMAEWLDKHESGNTHTRAHSRVLIGGGGRGGGFDREKRSGLGGDGRYRGGGRGEGSHFNRRGDGGDDRGGRSVERSATPAVEVAVRAAATSTRVREGTKKPDRKSCMMCGKDAGQTTECGKLRKFVARIHATDDEEPNKTPQRNGYAHDIGDEDKEVFGLTAASLRAQRKRTETQRRGVNTVCTEDRMHSRAELAAKLTGTAQSTTVPVSLANGGEQPLVLLMEIAKRLVKHEPVEAGWEKHAVMRALVGKRVTISLMKTYQLERSGGGMMEDVLATSWGGVEEVADHDKNGIKSAAEEKAVGGEAEAERSFAFYRPGQLARRREEKEDRERAKTQREATAAAETSACYRNASLA